MPTQVILGFGVGSVFFGEALRLGFASALISFSGVAAIAAIAAIPAFRMEGPAGAARGPDQAGA